MDADVEYRVTRSGRRIRQLLVIPDADISDAETDSDDNDPDYGSTVHDGQSSNESEWSTDDEAPLAFFKDRGDSGAARKDVTGRGPFSAGVQ